MKGEAPARRPAPSRVWASEPRSRAALLDDAQTTVLPRVPEFMSLPTTVRYRVWRPFTASRANAWAVTSLALVAVGVSSVLPLLSTDAPTRIAPPVAVAAAAPSTAAASVPAAVTAVPGPSAVPELPTPALPALGLSRSEPVRVSLPALGVVSDVIGLGLEPDGEMEVPQGAYPVGWYRHSPTPGELGPAVVAGHVDWEGERGAFHGLQELVVGDQVLVDRTDGSSATFVVDRVERYSKTTFPTTAVYGDIDHAGLRLITCGGAFDERTREYLDNVVVYASLVPSLV